MIEHEIKYMDGKLHVTRKCKSRNCQFGGIDCIVQFPIIDPSLHYVKIQKKGVPKCNIVHYLKESDLEQIGLTVLKTDRKFHVVHGSDLYEIMEKISPDLLPKGKLSYIVPISLSGNWIDKEKKVKACRIVVCDVMDRVKDVLVNEFMKKWSEPAFLLEGTEKRLQSTGGNVTLLDDDLEKYLEGRREEIIETFNEVRKEYMSWRCGKAINRFTTAVVLFAVTLIKLGYFDDYSGFDDDDVLSYPRMSVVASLEARKYYEESGKPRAFYFDSSSIKKKVKKYFER